jgi:hypothetical protein
MSTLSRGTCVLLALGGGLGIPIGARLLASQAPPSEAAGSPETTERVAAAIDRCAGLLPAAGIGDPLLEQIRSSGEATIASARDALRGGRPWLALQRLEPGWINLGSADYVAHCAPETKSDATAFEVEWKRMRGELADALGDAKPDGLAELRPAAVRAIAEVTWLQVRAFYDASFEYAQNTDARFGLYYMGQAQAAHAFVALCRTLGAGAGGAAAAAAMPTIPSLASEIDRLERDLFAAYRPPFSLALHDRFISASALLKEAKELDAAGLHAGALLTYLEGAQQSAALRSRPAPLKDEELARRLQELDATLAAAGDVSIGALFRDAVEVARRGPAADPTSAAVVATDVLPRFLAAIDPARPPPPPPPRARVTVTLVRWPYT